MDTVMEAQLSMDFLYEKLGEANYFLAKMSETQNDRVFFGYNLSAFLSAFYSIADFPAVKKKNDLELTGLEQKPWQDKEIDFLCEVRDRTLHTSTISRRAVIEVTLNVPCTMITLVTATLVRADGTEEPVMGASEKKKSVEDKDVNKHSIKQDQETIQLHFKLDRKLRRRLKNRNIEEKEAAKIISKDIVTLCTENIEKLGKIIGDLEK